MSNTPQGGTKEGNAADDILMVDQVGVMTRYQIIETYRDLNPCLPVRNPGQCAPQSDT